MEADRGRQSEPQSFSPWRKPPFKEAASSGGASKRDFERASAAGEGGEGGKGEVRHEEKEKGLRTKYEQGEKAGRRREKQQQQRRCSA